MLGLIPALIQILQKFSEPCRIGKYNVDQENSCEWEKEYAQIDKKYAGGQQNARLHRHWPSPQKRLRQRRSYKLYKAVSQRFSRKYLLSFTLNLKWHNICFYILFMKL